MNPEVDRQRAERRRHLLARMAGNVAAGMVHPTVVLPRSGETGWGTTRTTVDFTDPSAPESVAKRAVAIARAILEELER